MLSPNGITTIVFDLDGTLRHNRPHSNTVFLDYVVSLGVPDMPENRRRSTRWTHYYWAQSTDLVQDLLDYEGDQDGFWTNYARRNLEKFGCDPARAVELAPQVHAYMKAEHQPEDWVPEDVPTTLKLLKEAGFRLALLSKCTKPCHELLDTLGLGEYFELAMVAGEVSLWKPDPQVFEHALDRMDVCPEHAIYVGDNYYADILGAEKAGLHPVLIDPEGLFPESQCPVIHSLAELPQVIIEKAHSHAAS